MKNSTKILGTTLLVVTGLIIIGMIGTRIYLDRQISGYTDYGNVEPGDDVTMDFELKDFSSLSLEGAWEVRITQSQEYAVQVEGPENLLDRVTAQQTGQTLTVRNDIKSAFDGNGFTLNISMPDLKGIVIAGGADMRFSGFTGESLSITLAGAGKIKGLKSEYTDLNLICAGAGQMDMRGVKSIDASVNLSGAGEILLDMAGGTLGGVISGMGSVEYGGYVKEENIRVSGLGSVSP